MKSRKPILAALVAVVLAGAWWLWPDSGPDRHESQEPGASERSDESGAPRRAGPGPGDLDPPGDGDRPGPAIRYTDADFAKVNQAGEPIFIAVDGRVFDVATGQSLAGVEVVFRVRFGVGENAATSESDGTYALAVKPNWYRVFAFSDGVFGLVDKPVPVTRHAEAVKFDIPATRLARISGTVVDGRGAGVPGATVRFESQFERGRYDSDQMALYMPGTAQTDGAGGFVLDVVPGEVLLTAELDGATGRAQLTAEPGVATEATIVLDATVTVAGRVVDSGDQPIAGATVKASLRQPGVRGTIERDAVSGPDGRFQLDRMSPGQVSLVAKSDDRGASEIVSRTLQSGESVDVVLTIDDPVSLAGRIVDTRGGPIAGAKILAVRRGMSSSNQSVVSDENGEFRFDSLAAATYNLHASKEGVGKTWRKQVPAPASGIELRLLLPGTIRGVVTTSDGVPLDTFSVRIVQATLSLDGNTGQSTKSASRFTGAGGLFELKFRPPGRYHLVASAPGYGAATAVVEVASGESADVEFALPAGSSLSGVVRSTDGAPISNAAVTALSGYEGHSVRTDAQGRFTLNSLAAGRRSLRASHPDHVTSTVSDVAVGAGAGEVLIEMRPRGKGDDDLVEVVGIGALVEVRRQQLRIRQIVPDGPATRAGLRAGDEILAIDGVTTGDTSLTAAAERIRGSAGTVVRLQVRRGGQTFTVEVTRDRVRARPQSSAALASASAPPSLARPASASSITRPASGPRAS